MENKLSRQSTSNVLPLSTFIIVVLAACYVLARVVFWFSAEVGGDEAYYWVWGQRPELSYFDHPPLIAWTQGLFASVFGQSITVLRLPNLLTTGIIFYTYYLISRRLYPGQYRTQFMLVAFTLAASPMLFVFLAPAIMDHILIMLLLASAYLVVFYLDDVAAGRSVSLWRLYTGAALLGLAGITKYNAVFLGVGIALTILMHPRLRPLLRQPHIYLAGLLTLVMLAPVLMWNIENDFASFRYHLVDRNSNTESLQFHPEILAGFVVGSILVMSPFTFWMAIRRFIIDTPVRPSQWLQIGNYPVYTSVALITFVCSTGLFMSRSLFSSTYLYWNIPAYLLLLPLLGTVLIDSNGKWARRKLFIGQQVYGILLVGLVVFNDAILPLDTWSRQGRGDQGSRHWYGWSATADAILEEIGKKDSALILLTADHHVAGALSFTMNRTDIVAVSSRRDQYDFWWDDSQYAGRDGLVIFDEWSYGRKDVLSLFNRVGPARKIQIKKYGYPIKVMYLQRVYGYRQENAP